MMAGNRVIFSAAVVRYHVRFLWAQTDGLKSAVISCFNFLFFSVGWTKLLSARIRMTQFMSVARRRSGQIVFETLNHATCDVYSPKAVKKNNTGKMLRILVPLMFVKYIFFGFDEALDLKKLRIDGMCWHCSFHFRYVTKSDILNFEYLLWA